MESTLILRQDKVLDVDETDNIVFIILIDRKPCVHGITEHCKYIIIGSIKTDRYHIDPGDHDVLGMSIGKIKHIVDQLSLFGFNDAILVADIYIGLQLTFCHGTGFFIRINM